MNHEIPVILVIDDDKNILRYVEVNLRKENKYDVIVATSAESGLKILDKNRSIKIVLLDIMMPAGMDGIATLKLIKERYPYIEVIMMTAHGTIEKAVTAMKLGAVDFITKPFDTNRLLVTIRNYVHKVNSDSIIAMLIGKTFISYAREDKVQVENLYDKLKYAGLNPWMDTKDILPGEVWEITIEKAIKHSDFFLACLSNNSISKRGLVQKEIKIALQISEKMLEHDIFLIPVRLEGCGVPGSLQRFQWVDFFQPDGWNRLFEALKIGLKRRYNKNIHKSST